MTKERAIELLKIEKQCINCNETGDCDRDCGKCLLVQDTYELLAMYDFVINKLEED